MLLQSLMAVFVMLEMLPPLLIKLVCQYKRNASNWSAREPATMVKRKANVTNHVRIAFHPVNDSRWSTFAVMKDVTMFLFRVLLDDGKTFSLGIGTPYFSELIVLWRVFHGTTFCRQIQFDTHRRQPVCDVEELGRKAIAGNAGDGLTAIETQADLRAAVV